ncbi:unnamed protein product [Penicillium olsonii]|uniref:Carboxylic ester hydrolase n=1 Tax=Penicillium olsonii TaxID=99116 RepID=A0A9W4HB75_PENOL|nr:unnamed protein product [Penicillium olsonii]
MVSSYVYLLGLSQFLTSALSANTGRVCAPETFASLSLPSIDVLSIDAKLNNASFDVDDSTNAYPVATNKTVEVCQLTVNYTHLGWNDNVTTWISLPVDNWNGRFMGMGGGGWIMGTRGRLSQAVFGGYAAASTNGGHDEAATVKSWGLSSEGNVNWANMQDFSAVSLDDTASLGKAATKMFYGKPHKYAYWNGCSTGGRQGHMMAQRYPTQYDGILAGSPAINWDKFIPSEFWPQMLMNALDYYPSACELNAFTEHAIDECDALDGVKDRIISVPGLCKYNATSLVGKTVQCSSNSTVKITPKAAKYVTLVWAGPQDPSGSSLWYGLSHDATLTRLAGTNCTLPSKNCQPIPFQISADWQQIFLARNSSLDVADITYTEYIRHFRQSVNEYSSIIGTRDPDLTDFKQAGGKMIAWHGMKDPLIFFNGTENYYRQAMEIDPSIQDYYRFFAAPGADHCKGGIGFYPGSSLDSLVNWVENGTAPDTLRAIATPTGTDSAKLPLRTADLCAYPKFLTYVGGDASKASSFTCK